MNESDKRKYGYYFFIFISILCFIINLIIAYSKFTESSGIRNNPYNTFATVIKEEQNVFGGQKSYKYLLRYNFNNISYDKFELGIHEHNYYKLNQKIEIVLNRNNPEMFVIKEEINKYLNHLLISVFSLLIFVILIKFKSKIVNFFG